MPPPKPRHGNKKLVLWIWGDARTNKSTDARIGDYYLKLGNKWWDGYKGQKRVVFEDIGKEAALALTDKLKLWADPHFDQTGETKGGLVALTYNTFIVTANWHPYEVWKDHADYEPLMKRFKVSDKRIHIAEKKDDEEESE